MISCGIIYNTPCLKCNKLKSEMVGIGEIVMCQKCFEEEFNTEKIDPESEISKKYYKWLELYKTHYDY